MSEFGVPVDGRDSDSFASLYDEHRDVVYGVASGLAALALAADITQDVFIRMWLDPQRFDPPRGSMRNFLVTITRNVAVDYLRCEDARRRRDADLPTTRPVPHPILRPETR